MNHSALRRLAAGAALSALTVAGVTGVAHAAPGGEPGQPLVEVQLLALNDFHGALEPPTGSGGRVQTGVDATGGAVTVDAAGAEYLATQLAALAEAQGRTTRSPSQRAT